MGTKRSGGQWRPRWENLADPDLLRMRFSALGLRPEQSSIWPDVERLYAEPPDADVIACP
jgi:hypothetical protein